MQGLLVLTNFPMIDQWKNPVEWKSFEKVPKVLVFGGNEAAKESTEWGNYINETFNPGYVATSKHLQSLDDKEKIKVVAVISLPSVPGLFKGMVYGGFKKKSPSMGVALDFESKISGAYGYDREDPLPLVAVVSAKKDESVKIFKGKLSDEKLKADVVKAIQSELK